MEAGLQTKVYDLEIRNVGKQFRAKDRTINVLEGLDLRVEKGEFLSIVGGSGCGKSTLLRLIVGLESEFSGEITVANSENNATLKVGLVFQDHRLFPWLTVAGNVAFGLGSNFEGDRRRIVGEHLALVGLSDYKDNYPRQLSGGMRQRVGIARALVSKPDILLLDEPFGALDALTRIKMQYELLKIWKHEETTMIIVTHDIDEAIYLGDRVAVMSSDPGSFQKIVEIPLPRPRDRNSFDFVRVKKEIYLEFFSEEEVPFDFSI